MPASACLLAFLALLPGEAQPGGRSQRKKGRNDAPSASPIHHPIGDGWRHPGFSGTNSAFQTQRPGKAGGRFYFSPVLPKGLGERLPSSLTPPLCLVHRLCFSKHDANLQLRQVSTVRFLQMEKGTLAVPVCRERERGLGGPESLCGVLAGEGGRCEREKGNTPLHFFGVGSTLSRT